MSAADRSGSEIIVLGGGAGQQQVDTPQRGRIQRLSTIQPPNTNNMIAKPFQVMIVYLSENFAFHRSLSIEWSRSLSSAGSSTGRPDL